MLEVRLRLKKSRESRGKKRKDKIIREYVKVVDRWPNRCVLCSRKFKEYYVKIMLEATSDVSYGLHYQIFV